MDAEFTSDDGIPASVSEIRLDPIVKILSARPNCKYFDRQSEPVVPIRGPYLMESRSKQISARANRRFHYQTRSASSLDAGEMNLPFIRKSFLYLLKPDLFYAASANDVET